MTLPTATLDFTGANGDLGNLDNWTIPGVYPPQHRLPNSGDTIILSSSGTYSGNASASLWYYGQLTGDIDANIVHGVEADGGSVQATTAYASGASNGGLLQATTGYNINASSDGVAKLSTAYGGGASGGGMLSANGIVLNSRYSEVTAQSGGVVTSE
jgi:hypothetical protein